MSAQPHPEHVRQDAAYAVLSDALHQLAATLPPEYARCQLTRGGLPAAAVYVVAAWDAWLAEVDPSAPDTLAGWEGSCDT